MSRFSLKLLGTVSFFGIATAFGAAQAAEEHCTVITPATDIILAKMITQNTKMEWYKLVPPLAQNSDFAEAWIETTGPGGSSFYEDVSGDVIYGDAGFTANVQGQGEAFRSLGKCDEYAMPLSAAAAKAVAGNKGLAERMAAALPGGRVTEAAAKSGRDKRSGLALTIKGADNLVALHKALVGGGELPMGLDGSDVTFNK